MVGTKDGHVNTSYSASDILSFYGTILSFIGTVILGVIALWQNSRLNEINMHLQKTQMREQIGVLFPQRMPDEYKEFAKFNPLTPLQCGGLLNGNTSYKDNANMLHISLENRGRDIIFNCIRMKSYVDGTEVVEATLYGHGLLLRLENL